MRVINILIHFCCVFLYIIQVFILYQDIKKILETKYSGLYGKSNLDALIIDQVVHLGLDLMNSLVKAHYEQDETKKVTKFCL